MITILSPTNHEIGEALTLDDAIYAMKILVKEEEVDLRAVNTKGTVLAWVFADSPDTIGVIQGARR
jgi:hypothetical protein